jgi:aromatase
MSGHTDNSILIAADIDYVWTLTNDLEQWPQLFTEYASVEILDRHDNTVRFRLTMRPNPDGVAWSWVSQRTLDEAAHRVTASRIELGWFERMDIEWTYEAEDGGTRMRWVQDFAMNAQSPVTLPAMTDHINRNSAVQMEHIRAEVERRWAQERLLASGAQR